MERKSCKRGRICARDDIQQRCGHVGQRQTQRHRKKARKERERTHVRVEVSRLKVRKKAKALGRLQARKKGIKSRETYC